MKRFRLIPFWMLPMSWGLAGPQREEREAYYHLDGYDLEERLAEINLSGDELKKEINELKFAHELISEVEYDKTLAELKSSDEDREVALLEARIRHGEIETKLGEKMIATVRGEPWISVVKDGINPEDGVNGYFFEFDWNHLWIEALREAGYVGKTEESIVQSWFQAVCNNEASMSMGVAPINGGGVVY